MNPPLALTALHVHGFRNLADTDLRPGPGINVLHGPNGAGKTNLLEAIGYVGWLRSFRGAPADDLICETGSHAVLTATISAQPLAHQAEIRLERDKRRDLLLDGKKPKTLFSWMSRLPLVIFHPGDLLLVSGAPERRRALLDQMMEKIDPVFAASRAAYEKALRSRNKVIRTQPTASAAIRAYDEILASAGEVIGKARIRLVEEIGPLAEREFCAIMGAALGLRIQYVHKHAPNANVLREALLSAEKEDLARKSTTVGPHTDDLRVFVRADKTARHHASQGQHRALVLALKLAEAETLARATGRDPVILLDDVSSELDRERTDRFLDRLRARGGQVFLTTTNAEALGLGEETARFAVTAGTVTGPSPGA